MKTPLKPEDMNQFAGQWCEAESSMMDILPSNKPIIVGGNRAKPESIPRECYICHGSAYLHPKDFPAAIDAHPDIIVLCPACYFGMEPKEIDGLAEGLG